MTILDQRMHAWRAEPAAERGEFRRAEILVAKHKHRMFGEGVPDPGESRLIERLERSMPNASEPSGPPSGRSSGNWSWAILRRCPSNRRGWERVPLSGSGGSPRGCLETLRPTGH